MCDILASVREAGAAGAAGVGEGWGRGQEGPHRVMEAVHVLTGVEVSQVCVFIQTHPAELLRSMCFILCKLQSIKKRKLLDRKGANLHRSPGSPGERRDGHLLFEVSA